MKTLAFLILTLTVASSTSHAHKIATEEVEKCLSYVHGFFNVRGWHAHGAARYHAYKGAEGKARMECAESRHGADIADTVVTCSDAYEAADHNVCVRCTGKSFFYCN